jgi:hypothetical protein
LLTVALQKDCCIARNLRNRDNKRFNNELIILPVMKIEITYKNLYYFSISIKVCLTLYEIHKHYYLCLA